MSRLKAAQIACTNHYIHILDSTHRLWEVENLPPGYPTNFQLGRLVVDNYPFTQIGTASNWTQVACGDHHVVALKSDGTLWGLGSNSGGQIGVTENSSTFAQIETANDWVQVDCGSYHTVALKSDGTLWGLGSNYYGQIGGGNTTENKTSLTQIGTSNDWAQVTCGGYHTIAKKQDGTLWGLGRNGRGQIGEGASVKTALTQIEGGNDWVQVACGGHHTVVLKNDGTLWGLGDNEHGQIGGAGLKATLTQIETDQDWSQVFCRHSHTVAIKKDGTLWRCGVSPQHLGRGTIAPLSPQRGWVQADVAGANFIAIDSQGRVFLSPRIERWI